MKIIPNILKKIALPLVENENTKKNVDAFFSLTQKNINDALRNCMSRCPPAYIGGSPSNRISCIRACINQANVPAGAGNTNSSMPINTATLVGSIIGGVAILSIFCISIFCITKRCINRQAGIGNDA